MPKLEHFVAGEPGFTVKLNALVDAINELSETPEAPASEAPAESKPAAKPAAKSTARSASKSAS